MQKSNPELFLQKLNSTHWAKLYPDSILPFDDYYRVLLTPSTLIQKLTGYFEKTNTKNKVSIYQNENGDYIAQVASYKHFIKNHQYTKDQLIPMVSVATYINWENNIILLNHFDAVGYNHTNNYTCYPTKTRYLYEKYYTDKIVEDNGVKYHHSHCPHFHFSSSTQTKLQLTQEHPNAISIDQILIYLDDLKSCKDKNNILLSEDLNMPFLAFYKNDNTLKYNSLFLNLAEKYVNILQKNNIPSEEIEFLTKLNRLYNSTNPQNNIDKIILDLKVLKRIIKKFQNNLELISVFTNAFVKSVNLKAYEVGLNQPTSQD